MIRQLPIIPTIIVVAAAAVMVSLGVWQLGRADEKAALIARYSEASANTQEVAFPYDGTSQDVWFRKSSVYCGDVWKFEPVAGTSARGEKGWVVRAICHDYFAEESPTVDMGFTRDVNELPEIDQLRVSGVVAPGPRLVASPPVAELEPLALPNPNDLPNNHLAYAFQWFFFALTALVIYGFAVRSRLAKRD